MANVIVQPLLGEWMTGAQSPAAAIRDHSPAVERNVPQRRGYMRCCLRS
jgi:hypothetical protein